jgi:tetratricopeptide (TPR) repeat protein
MGQRKPAEAADACRAALERRPGFAEAHHFLGVVREAQGKLDEAVGAYREAVRLRPDDFEAWANLGSDLFFLGRLDEAAAANQAALGIRPDPRPFTNLGNDLIGLGRPAEAEDAFRSALRLQSDLPEALLGLGSALRLQGRLAESLEAFRRSHELGSKRPGWPYPTAVYVRKAEHLVEGEKRLPAFLSGAVRPADAEEALTAGQVCGVTRRFAAAARFYAAGFAASPALANNLEAQLRYNAAGCAARAGCGQGDDAPADDAGQARLRRQAREWLAADRAAWAALLDADGDRAAAAVQKEMRQWRRDADLAGVRDAAAVENLPEDERKEWRKLWADVDALAKRTARK